MNIKLIDNQRLVFCTGNRIITLTARPLALYIDNDLFPKNPVVKGSTLGWYIERQFISYNQLKNILYDIQNR